MMRHVVEYPDGTETSHREVHMANREAMRHYLEAGEVPRVVRADGSDAGLAAVMPGCPEGETYHHGSGHLDNRAIEAYRDDGQEVGLIDLDSGEELVAPTTERQHDPTGRMPTADEARERLRS